MNPNFLAARVSVVIGLRELESRTAERTDASPARRHDEREAERISPSCVVG
jgi:hypothetical protein